MATLERMRSGVATAPVVTVVATMDGCVDLRDESGMTLRALLPHGIGVSTVGQRVVASYVTNELDGQREVVVLGLRPADATAEAAHAHEMANHSKRQPERHGVDGDEATGGQLETGQPGGAGAKPWTPLGELTPSVGEWKIRVRVARKSGVIRFRSGNGELFNADVEDDLGQRMRVVAFNDECTQYHPMLRVGRWYAIANGRLKQANAQYNTLGHPFELTLSATSLVEEVPADAGAPTERFAGLATLRTDTTVDVAAIVAACGDLIEYTKNERVNTRRSYELADPSGGTLEVTVFGASRALARGTPVAVRGLKVSTWQERLSAIASSEAFDDELPAAVAQPLVAWWDGAAARDVRERTRPRCDALADIAGDGKYVSTCSLSYVHDAPADKYPLWFVACPDCGKKLPGAHDTETAVACESCDAERCGVRRWLWSAVFADASGSRTLTVFDEVATRFLRMTATEYHAAHGDDPSALHRLLRERPHTLRVECKVRTDGEETRAHCTRIVPVEPVAESRRVLEEIFTLSASRPPVCAA